MRQPDDQEPEKGLTPVAWAIMTPRCRLVFLRLWRNRGYVVTFGMIEESYSDIDDNDTLARDAIRRVREYLPKDIIKAARGEGYYIEANAEWPFKGEEDDTTR